MDPIQIDLEGTDGHLGKQFAMFVFILMTLAGLTVLLVQAA